MNRSNFFIKLQGIGTLLIFCIYCAVTVRTNNRKTVKLTYCWFFVRSVNEVTVVIITFLANQYPRQDFTYYDGPFCTKKRSVGKLLFWYLKMFRFIKYSFVNVTNFCPSSKALSKKKCFNLTPPVSEISNIFSCPKNSFLDYIPKYKSNFFRVISCVSFNSFFFFLLSIKSQFYWNGFN